MTGKNQQALEAFHRIQLCLASGEEPRQTDIATIEAALKQPEVEHIKGAGVAASPLIRRAKDEDGNAVVILAEWWYEEITANNGGRDAE